MDYETLGGAAAPQGEPKQSNERSEVPIPLSENLIEPCGEFIGSGLRPPGKYIMQLAANELEINAPVMISAIHKLTRRDDSSNLKGLLHCGLLALEKREKTAGVKSVVTQFKHRVFLTIIEEGIAIFAEPKISENIVDCIIGMFNSDKLEVKLENSHKLCDLMNGLYRGRIISGLMSWCKCDDYLLKKLMLPQPPAIEWGDAMNLNLSTQRDKIRMKNLIISLGNSKESVNWLLKIIPEVNHKEFNRFLIFSAILSNEKFHEKLPKSKIIQTDITLPTIEYMKTIGVYDCHTGRGNFNDFLNKGMLVTNMAPVTIYGKSLKEIEEIYLKIKKETGSKRFSNKHI
tara:strand:+ start:369 stop:1400 length:1032 start_codon:yes stop_codon:yes gene_type:complete